MENKVALITGVFGQDGSYLAERLLLQGYTVLGVAKKKQLNFSFVNHSNFKLFIRPQNELDLRQFYWDIISSFQPQESYLLAAHHFSSEKTTSNVEDGFYLFNLVNTLEPYWILNSLSKLLCHGNVFVAGSCHLFGDTYESPQNEKTVFSPTNFYGISKLNLYYLVKYFRSESKLKITFGILYNHESSRRQKFFLTKKIAQAAVKVKLGIGEKTKIGSLKALVDWGFAPEFVVGFHECTQRGINEDLIFATGVVFKVEDFVRQTFNFFELNWEEWIVEDSECYQLRSKVSYIGNPEKIVSLGFWKPKTPFVDMVKEIAENTYMEMCK